MNKKIETAANQWISESDINEEEVNCAREGFYAGVNWAYASKNLRKEAWKIYKERQVQGYTEDQLKCLLAGMFILWRLLDIDGKPLFTFGLNGLPCELNGSC